MEEVKNRIITFEINKHGWVLLFQKLGPKVFLVAESIEKKNKRFQNDNGHRMDMVETEGTTMAKPKYDWDISKFPEKNN